MIQDFSDIEEKANGIRQDVVEMLVEAGSGHSAGSLGIVDVLTALYFGEVLSYKVNESEWEERDRLVLSAGHLVPALYAVLSRAGFFSREELFSLRQLGSRLQGHPHFVAIKEETLRRSDTSHSVRSAQDDKAGMRSLPALSIGNLPGIEVPAGPLGQGVSMAVGMAVALRARSKMQDVRCKIERCPRVVCISSDGEMQEGQVWEAIMTASTYKLDHLTFVIDRNRIQISGKMDEVMPIESLRGKLEAFGLMVIEVDGHNIGSLIEVFTFDASVQSKPVAIIAHTIPGKGVSFMEGNYKWHGKAPSKEEGVKALEELRS